MFDRRSRDVAAPAIALAVAGVVAGALAAGLAARRRRRAKGASMADANKRIIQRLFEEPWTGNFDVIDEFVAPDYVGHDPSEQEPTRGPDGVKEFIERYRSAFDGARLTVDDQIADGDKVATRWTARGTHTGEIAGIAPTGKDVTVTGLTISRFAGAKVVEEWTTWDTLGMLVQLGVIPAPARA